ncbi:MAG: glycosyltransferase, exosortase A system-associated [Acidobacteriota bacterium]|nr:glycosyltransferase, exosortase A system-associated [Acidobacteriota bacterium]
MRILHVLDHSLPYFSGYSFRSQYILRAQRQLGLDVFAVTSPKHERFDKLVETIDGIEYHRTEWPTYSKVQGIPLAKQIATVAKLAKEVSRLAVEINADVIHAHSPSLCGLAAAKAARSLKLPMVYELRYYEEDAAVDRGKTSHNSLRYRLGQQLEQQALEQADAVTTISHALHDDLVRRGISPDKIFEIPNGVDTESFKASAPDEELILKYGLRGNLVIGFIGSFYFYEGLDTLVDAVILLLAQRNDVKLLLVGDGEACEMLRQRLPENLRQHFIFTGNVPHEEIRRYYSVMEILIYPRRRSRLTELTTPLKPLEALAMGKVVIASDVGGLRELLGDGKAGYLVEAENETALAKQLLLLAKNERERRMMAQQAREFVVVGRGWQHIAERYFAVYDYACNKI